MEKIQTITNIPPPRLPIKTSASLEAAKEKIGIMEECGIDMSQGYVCFMCFGTHVHPNCLIYPPGIEYGEMCRQTIDGEKYIFGFHPKSSCKHGNDISQGRKFTGSQSDNRDQQAPRYGQPFPNNNWKPYRG